MANVNETNAYKLDLYNVASWLKTEQRYLFPEPVTASDNLNDRLSATMDRDIPDGWEHFRELRAADESLLATQQILKITSMARGAFVMSEVQLGLSFSDANRAIYKIFELWEDDISYGLDIQPKLKVLDAPLEEVLPFDYASANHRSVAMKGLRGFAMSSVAHIQSLRDRKLDDRLPRAAHQTGTIILNAGIKRGEYKSYQTLGSGR